MTPASAAPTPSPARRPWPASTWFLVVFAVLEFAGISWALLHGPRRPAAATTAVAREVR